MRSLVLLLATAGLLTVAGCDAAQRSITPTGTDRAPSAKVDNTKGGEKLVLPAPGK